MYAISVLLKEFIESPKFRTHQQLSPCFMSHPLIHECANYVVLEPGKPEEILTDEETLEWLKKWLEDLDELPKDLQTQPSLNAVAQRLIDTDCDLEIQPGFTLQWFAVRVDPPQA